MPSWKALLPNLRTVTPLPQSSRSTSAPVIVEGSFLNVAFLNVADTTGSCLDNALPLDLASCDDLFFTDNVQPRSVIWKQLLKLPLLQTSTTQPTTMNGGKSSPSVTFYLIWYCAKTLLKNDLLTVSPLSIAAIV
jgi:hypothetical protein